ncbi:MAG TPA: hypothetical protein VJH33_00450 [Candidatus Paceibacterota bacterium]
MFPIPSLHGRERIVAVADIGSASVGVAIGRTKQDHVNVFASATATAPVMDRSREHTIATVSSLFSDALEKVRLYPDASNITHTLPEQGILVMQSPWSRTVTKMAERTFDAEEHITKGIIGELAREALASGDTPEHAFETTVIRVALNGYPTAQPVGKYATHIAVFVLVSDGEAAIVSAVSNIFKEHYGIEKPIYRSGARALLSVIHQEVGVAADYMAVHITDGSMYFLVIREGIPTATSILPLGLHEILKKIAGKNTPEEMLSMFSLVERNMCSKDACVQFKNSLATFEPEWVRATGDTMAELSLERKLPQDIWLSVDSRVGTWFVSLFSRFDFEQFTVTAKPFRVREITMHKGNVEYQEGVHPDSSLKIALELVNIERAQLL